MGVVFEGDAPGAQHGGRVHFAQDTHGTSGSIVLSSIEHAVAGGFVDFVEESGSRYHHIIRRAVGAVRACGAAYWNSIIMTLGSVQSGEVSPFVSAERMI